MLKHLFNKQETGKSGLLLFQMIKKNIVLNRRFLLLIFIFLSGCKTATDPIVTAGSGSLSGTVKAFAINSANPVSPGGIQIELQGTQFHGNADSLGNFRIDNIPAGVYNIIFWKTGFDSMIYPVHHLLGAGNDIINDAYLVAESTDSLIMKLISPLYLVSVTKLVHIIDTLIKIDPGGGKDTIVRQYDTTIITYDTARTPIKLIMTCGFSGNQIPDNMYVYSSLDSGVYPSTICRETNNLTMDAWLGEHVNDTSFHTSFQVPHITNGIFSDTVSADVIGRKPFTFESGQKIYIYFVGHSNTRGLPSLGGQYEHFLTTPFGPQVMRYRFVIP
jgi:hypothetical protein